MKGHYISAACQLIGIKGPDSIPDSEKLIQLQHRPEAEQRQYIYSIAQDVVEKCSIVEGSVLFESVDESGDMVHNYAQTLCHYGSLALEFVDAWEEGDGERVLRCWKIFLLHFYANGRTKYSLEALRLQLQVATLPPYLSNQIKWNRFVNTRGGLGRNIPCDLFNEHVNKLFKEIITNMGANLSEHSLQRAARVVTTLHQLRTNFDKQSGVPVCTSAHSTRSDYSDVLRVAVVVSEQNLLQVMLGRSHSRFDRIVTNPLFNLKKDRLQIWIENRIKMTIKYSNNSQAGDQSDSEASDDEC